MSISYKSAGVDIDAGNESVSKIKPLIEKTYSSAVKSPIGSFCSLYDLEQINQKYKHPMLVQSIDGVGTKMMVAKMMDKFDTIGIDLVSATANDIIVMGATPLTLLDYIATDKLNVANVEAIVKGIASACFANNISLVGGETAEMPGTYAQNEYDLAGIVTGVVEREKVINGENIAPEDVIIGLSSNGLHTNGYSLARKLCFDTAKMHVHTYVDELKETIGEALLMPHINYTQPILKILGRGLKIKGMAHITGGGLIDNLPRILPENCSAFIDTKAYTPPPIFHFLAQIAKIDNSQLYKTFNMGIGFVIIVAEKDKERAISMLQEFDEFTSHVVGHIHNDSVKTVRVV